MTDERGTRLTGAILAAILAGFAILAAVRVDALLVANPADSPIAVVFGPDGIAAGQPLAGALAWAVGPVAAAVAGWAFAGGAIRRVGGSGLWMGGVTYLVAIALAPIVLLPGASEASLSEWIGAVATLPLVWLIAGALLGPLLLVCLAAGPTWATILRLTTAGGVDPARAPRPLQRWPVAVLAVLTLAGWAFAMTLLGSIGPGVVD